MAINQSEAAHADACQIEWQVEGMTCASCALSLENYLKKHGLESVTVDFAGKEARFVAPPEVSLANLKQGISNLGFSVVPQSSADRETHSEMVDQHNKKLLIMLVINISCTAPLLAAMAMPWPILHSPLVQLGLCLPVMAVGWWHFGRGAWYGLKSGVANMDVLITLGATAAFGYSLYGTLAGLGHDYMFYETAASILTIVLAGQAIEARALAKTRLALQNLFKQKPLTAKRLRSSNPSDGWDEAPAAGLQPGDRILLAPGDRVPADARLRQGYLMVDESMLTGEAIPIAKQLNEKLLGGSVVHEGGGWAEVVAVGAHSVYGMIVSLVKRAQSEKTNMQRLSDKISAIFVPTVMAIAAIAFGLAWIAFGLNPERALINAIAVLVISCPCAMGLAIPTAVVVGLGRAARLGVLVKSTQTFEKLNAVRHVVFDKTGTLTTGNFNISDFQVIGDADAMEAIAIIKGLEAHGNHPIARSLALAWPAVSPAPFCHTNEHKGLGIEGQTADGRTYRIGSERFRPTEAPALPTAPDLVLWRGNQPIASIGITDEIRPEAKAVVEQLISRGLRVAMLSGDTPRKCEAVCQAIGIQEVWPAQMPDQKLSRIKAWKQNGGVMMVGDGLNDAPALAEANVGAAIGTTAALTADAADVVFLRPDLTLVPKLFELSGQTLRTMRQNLFWAFFYNVGAIPIAAVGLLSPMIAAAAMALSSVLVVGNALRLRQRKFT